MISPKIKRVLANGRKRCFAIECSRGTYEFPFSLLKLKPSSDDPLVAVWVDSETGGVGFGYRLQSKKEDYIHVDSVLHHNKDPEYERDMLLYRLTIQAQDILKKKRIAKRELARKLKTSPKQLYRLLDQTFYGKTIDQMVKLLNALGNSVDFKITPLKVARR
jgi:hypothetical protein